MPTTTTTTTKTCNVAKIILTCDCHPAYEHSICIPFVYLHGQAEREFGYDIVVTIEGGFPGRPGMYDVLFRKADNTDVEATLFYWKRKNINSKVGLVVINDDIRAWANAYDKFTKKLNSI